MSASECSMLSPLTSSLFGVSRQVLTKPYHTAPGLVAVCEISHTAIVQAAVGTCEAGYLFSGPRVLACARGASVIADRDEPRRPRGPRQLRPRGLGAAAVGADRRA